VWLSKKGIQRRADMTDDTIDYKTKLGAWQMPESSKGSQESGPFPIRRKNQSKTKQ
jgi:hypothetical protein